MDHIFLILNCILENKNLFHIDQLIIFKNKYLIYFFHIPILIIRFVTKYEFLSDVQYCD